jgi:hypothetical protein
MQLKYQLVLVIYTQRYVLLLLTTALFMEQVQVVAQGAHL